MKVLFLCHKMPYPLADGGCIATFNMMQGMAQNGADIDALCMATPKHNSTLESMPESVRNQFNWHRVFVNTQVKAAKALSNLLFSKTPYNAERFISTEYTNKLKTLLASKTYDIIQLEGLYLSPYLPTIRANSSAKVVMRSHNVEHQIWDRMATEESNPLKRWYKQNIAKRVKKLELDSLNRIDALIPISTIDAAFFKKYFSGPTKVSSTGMPTNKFKEAGSNSVDFFHIGALDWEPNQAGMLWFLDNVWKPFKRENPNFNFLLAGRNAPDTFEKELENYPIHYLGEVPDACEFMDQHSIMVVPLFSGSGMRIKIIEAMARGKCIITTPIGAEGIPVERNKHITIAENANEMIAILKDIIAHPDKAIEMGNQAYIFAKKQYNNELITKELLQFYKQIFN